MTLMEVVGLVAFLVICFVIYYFVIAKDPPGSEVQGDPTKANIPTDGEKPDRNSRV